MTDEQKKTLRLLYKFIHDERAECGNLASLIEIQFPGDDEISNTLRTVVAPYLAVRQAMGATVMEIIYQIEGCIKAEEELEKVLKDGSGR